MAQQAAISWSLFCLGSYQLYHIFEAQITFNEVLNSVKNTQKLISLTKAIRNLKNIDLFWGVLQKCPESAFYSLYLTILYLTTKIDQ